VAHDSSAEDAPVHFSAPRVWQNAAPGDVHDYLTVRVSFRRGDEINHGGYDVGDCDMTVRFAGYGGALSVDDQGRCVLESDMTADRARDLARWLNARADEIDPHHTNGLGYPRRCWS
jgi:hypothetical protein